jgi:hypothetical protein
VLERVVREHVGAIDLSQRFPPTKKIRPRRARATATSASTNGRVGGHMGTPSPSARFGTARQRSKFPSQVDALRGGSKCLEKVSGGRGGAADPGAAALGYAARSFPESGHARRFPGTSGNGRETAPNVRSRS